MQVLVRDNNVDQALRVLKKKLQREGVFREMKLRKAYEKPSERKTREKAEAIRRARKLARKQAQREGLLPAPKPKPQGPGAARPPGRRAPGLPAGPKMAPAPGYRSERRTRGKACPLIASDSVRSSCSSAGRIIVPPGPYEIVRQLPSDTADRKYRIKSRDETHERVVAEHELRPAGEGERCLADARSAVLWAHDPLAPTPCLSTGPAEGPLALLVDDLAPLGDARSRLPRRGSRSGRPG